MSALWWVAWCCAKRKLTPWKHLVIKTGMDILPSLTPKIVMTNDPPWINKQMKSLIKLRQIGLGFLSQFA